jgi:adenosylcobinamide-phosphate synthase
LNWTIAAGVGLDLVLGDPRWLPHPVRGIGWLISLQEKRARRTRLAGVLLWVATVGTTAAIVLGSLRLAPLTSLYWIYSFVAIRDLDRQAKAVIDALPHLAVARERLSLIVGRDTADLDEPEIVRATVETVAENLSDGIVAPLFYLAFGGPAVMAAYKAVNTLDSMVGYRDERYRDLGWFPARADDWANWIPARLTAVLVWLVCLLPGFGLARSVRVTLRDANSQPSPNAGYPEAAVAGALGVQLGGLNYYRGVPSVKAKLGDAERPLDASIIPRLRLLLYGVALLATAGACLR